jgi:NAD(P)H-quinone oxidoreductase subunit 5
MTFTAISGTIETLFFGWELVGLSSTLLVAFFHERPMPVRNGLRVWSVYRVSDAALLLAAVALHHLADQGDFVALIRHQLETGAALSASQATLVGGLLLLAAAGKSALVPFSGWLPRAMEGPTPSSAVFYGAISVHLGAYLLIRSAPILEAGVLLEWVVVGLGLATALFGSVCGRVQTDIKGALSFASMTQVGLIVAEIGMGWHTLAMVHLCGHACLRTLQFLRAPSLLADYRTMENATGSGAADNGDPAEGSFARALYRFAIERGWLDAFLDRAVTGPVLGLFRAADHLERRLTDALHGRSAPLAPEPEDLA